jgi:hypothetical protein
MPVSQAEEMIRRVSPEGRLRAQRERVRRQRATTRLVGKCVLAAIAIVLAAVAAGFAIGPIGSAGFAVALVAWLVVCVAIVMMSRERPPTTGALAGAELHLLPERTGAWIEQQRPTLPAPAARLLDGIGARLEAMRPQLARLDAHEPAADAVRKLLSVELPRLIHGYQGVPVPLRGRPQASGATPDTQLLQGLGVIDSEIDRMTEQLARGAFDELATQGRYLELKYEGDRGLGG